MNRWVALLAELLVAGIVAVAVTVAFDAPPVLAGLTGLLYGLEAWMVLTYPRSSRPSLHALSGRDRWIAAAWALVTAAMLSLVDPLTLPDGQSSTLFLAMLGGVVSATTVGALIVAEGE